SHTTSKNVASNPDEAADKVVTALPTGEMSSDSEADADGDGDGGLEFVVEQDVVIDGRLQVEAEDIGTHKLLNPWQAKRDSDLPAKALVSIDDIQKVSLPQ
ncbi:MAG: hypothetical protein L0H35_03035, partial [Psychrobacter sp.]|nr:hypothetical protein [Psychrobacter sp.]